MRRALPIALALVVGFCLGATVWANRRPQPPAYRPDAPERAVRIDYADPTVPRGRRSVLLSVYRVTGGPEGTIEYAPVPVRPAPGGITDLVIGPELWVCSIGQRSYVFGPRD